MMKLDVRRVTALPCTSVTASEMMFALSILAYDTGVAPFAIDTAAEYKEAKSAGRGSSARRTIKL